MVRLGWTTFTWYTLANIGLGVWYYLAQPGPVRKLFMGGSGYATALFAVGLVVAIVMVIAGFLGRKRGPGFDLWPLSLLTKEHALHL